jgi:hypothetical protein
MPPQNTNQMTELEDALIAAFSLNSLKLMTRRRLGITLENEVNLAQGLKYIVSELVEVSAREGWRDELVRGAIVENPHPKLTALADVNKIRTVPSQLPGGPLPKSVDQGTLEKIVRERGGFIKWQDFVNRLSALGRHLCRIESSGSAVGTGWLVAPDLILTNYHVIESLKNGSGDAKDMMCRFDYFGKTGEKEVTCSLASGWEVNSCKYAVSDTEADASEATDDELDYAVVRLGRMVGDELLDDGRAKRGWIRVSATPPIVQQKDILLIPQHPDGRTLELAFGQALEFNSAGTRLHHDASTEPGSSGSPCLTMSLLPFALHHASGPGRALRYNQCVPIRKIVQRLSKQGVTPFWQI